MPLQATPNNPDFLKLKRGSFYYEQLKSLFENQLYTNFLAFSNWTLSLCETKSDIMTELQQLQVLIMSGDSAYHLSDYYRAESFYRRALQFYKPLLKSNPNVKQMIIEDCGTCNDLKFKIHLCLIQSKKSSDAMKMLMSIPAKNRNVQTNMALGKLLQANGMERAAATSYKEVLRVCPMALEAVEQLIRLGSTEDDIQSLVRDKIAKIMPYPEWYNGWIRANSAIASKEHIAGIKMYHQLHEKFGLFNCSSLMYSIGLANANYGDYPAAISALNAAHSSDSSNMKGMDLLAFLLWHEEKSSDLYKLMTKLNEMNGNDARPEPWIATAYYAQMMKRNPKGLLFATRGSTFLGTKVPEGLIAKGHMYLKLKKYQDAVDCFREAMSISPNRFEPHKGVVECYTAMFRTRDALTVATAASKKLGCTPRILTMLASTLKKDPTTVSKAKAYLERALSQDPRFVPAILSLVDIYEIEGKHSDAIVFLKSILDVRTGPPILHLKLAGLYRHTGVEDMVTAQYTVALRLDPTNKEAREGLRKLDPKGGILDTEFENVEDMRLDDDDDDDDADVADSEMEASIWEDFGLNESR